MPAVAEARYLRALYRTGLRIAYAGICPPVESADLDAAITFGDLEQLFRIGGACLAMPTWFERVPEERRRHLSAAGGMPLALLEESRYTSRRFRKVRGSTPCRRWRGRWWWTGWISASWTSSRRGSGPSALGTARGAVLAAELVASTEPPRSRFPVVDAAVVASVGATFAIKPRRMKPDPRRWPRSWSRSAGAERASVGLPGVRLRHLPAVRRGGGAGAGQHACTPYQERRANEAQRAAAVDQMTGLSTYRVLRDQLAFEVERSKRSNEGFAVLFLDLDRFKDVNDRGHEAGNDILRAVAGEIRNAVRASDVAARYGGDEFVVILTRTDLQGAARGRALRAGIEERVGG